jgi:hypothetical protein
VVRYLTRSLGGSTLGHHQLQALSLSKCHCEACFFMVFFIIAIPIFFLLFFSVPRLSDSGLQRSRSNCSRIKS